MDRVLVRRLAAKIELQEPHPGQPEADHELHPRIEKIVLGLQDQGLEDRDGIKWRLATLGSIAVAEPFDQPAAENSPFAPPLS